ncbi:MAG: Stp1/IreP family PP2C-type Ser/Thr phosphatase [Eubacteriales bacterium]|nr:Stp1/IreP family PP2C-type Ser/Thr phosphatase [Eubacteriales bacterium]
MNVYGKTDKGLVRSNNQDTYRTEVDKSGCAYLILCDGMGGARAGNVASAKTADVFLQYLREHCEPDMERDELARILIAGAAKANREVYEMAEQDPEQYNGMGTTLVGGVAIGDRIVLANIGDSRAYLLDGEQIAQITEDHSLVEEMVRAGRLSKEEARHYPGRNLITRAVGVDAAVEADLYEVILREGQILLLCSDGLSGMLSDGEIAGIVSSEENFEHACEVLIAEACEAGGTDNITVVLYTK